MKRVTRDLRWWLVAAALAMLLPAAGCSSRDAAKKPAPAPITGPSEAEQRKKSVDTRVAAGMEYLRQRDPEGARRHINRALEVDPDSASAHNAMGMVYRYEGDEKRAEDHFRRAIRIDSDFSQARNNYAALLYQQGRYDVAVDQLERAANDPKYDQRALAFMNLGRSYAKLGKLEEAAAALQRALRLDSKSPDAMLEAADVYLQLKRYREAQGYFQNFANRSRQTPRSLLIGIELARYFGDKDAQASYEFQLEKLYKGTAEYEAWRAQRDGRPAPVPRKPADED